MDRGVRDEFAFGYVVFVARVDVVVECPILSASRTSAIVRGRRAKTMGIVRSECVTSSEAKGRALDRTGPCSQNACNPFVWSESRGGVKDTK